MIFKGKISKGHCKMYMELQFLFFAYRPMMVYICTKYHENILDGMKDIERTRFSLEKLQRGIIP